jgi:hypothetical protein
MGNLQNRRIRLNLGGGTASQLSPRLAAPFGAKIVLIDLEVKQMTKQDFSRLFLAGFVATFVMCAVLYTAPLIGLPKMDMAAMLGWIFQGFTAEPRTGVWWAGMLIYFFTGSVILPLIFAALLASHLPGRPWNHLGPDPVVNARNGGDAAHERWVVLETCA